MQRMENEELLNYSGGGILITITNFLISIYSFAKAMISLKNLRG